MYEIHQLENEAKEYWKQADETFRKEGEDDEDSLLVRTAQFLLDRYLTSLADAALNKEIAQRGTSPPVSLLLGKLFLQKMEYAEADRRIRFS